MTARADAWLPVARTVSSKRLWFTGPPLLRAFVISAETDQVRDGEWDDQGVPGGSDSKESACSAGEQGSIPGSGRSPGEGSGNPLQYLSWKISWTEELGRLAHGTTKSCTRLSN